MGVCSGCGASTADGAQFCGSCGLPQPGAGAAPSALIPPPPPAPPATAAATNGFAVAALVVSLVSCGIGSVLGIVFGVIARRQIAERGERGAGMALAGIIIGSVGTTIMALYLIFTFVMLIN